MYRAMIYLQTRFSDAPRFLGIVQRSIFHISYAGTGIDCLCMVYQTIKEEPISRVERRRMAEKAEVLRDVVLQLTEKEIVFSDRTRIYRHTIRLPGVYRLGLDRKSVRGKTSYVLHVNDLSFPGSPELYDLIEEHRRAFNGNP